MRITLVGTGIALDTVGVEARRYNLSTAYLEAAVRQARDDVDVTRLDVPIRLDSRSFDHAVTRQVLDSRPDLLALSCFCWDLDAQLELARAVRREAPAVPVVVGGPSASYQADELIAREPAVDAVVRGEGEVTFVEVVSRGGRALDGVAGVSWRDGAGAARHEPDRPVIDDLGALASPLLTGVLEPPRQNLMLELSRGCLHRCTYCAWKTHGRGVRPVPGARVREEVAWAVERGYEHAFVIDSAVNDSDERLDDVVAAARAADPAGRLAYSYFVDHTLLTAAQVRRLATLRTHEVTVGLETLSAAALAAAGRRPVERDRFEAALDRLSEVAPATVSIMLGMPGDDLDGFRRTLDFVAGLAERPGRPRIRAVRVFWMLVAPGSTLWRRARRFGLSIASPGIPYVLGSASFPTRDLVSALRLLHDHPRADLFVWEDAEPLSRLDPDLPALFAARGDHLGGRAGARLDDDDALRAIRPLAPGRALPGGGVVAPLEHVSGYPVIVVESPAGQRVRLQIRPAGAEPRPYCRTRSFDLVTLPLEGPPENAQVLLGLLVELIKRNDR